MLNRGQFEGLANQLRTSGGFTVDVNTGHQPTSGVSVAVPGEEQFRRATGADLEGVAKRRADLLSKPGMHLGGWQAKDRELSPDVVDASKVIADHPQGWHIADVHHAMHVNRQDAAFDLSSGREITNPRAPYDWRGRNNLTEPDEYGSSVKIVKRNH